MVRARVRGQRAHVHDAARGPRLGGRDREDPAALARPRGHAPAPAALVDRRAHEPLHVDLVGRGRRRRARASSTSSCSTRGARDVLADEVGRAALRCIRCSACLNVCPVYERTGGHAYESVYPGPIGAILTPQLQGLENAPTLPWASSPVRRLLRGLPGQDRHPDDPRAPARARRARGRRAGARARGDGRDGARLRQPPRLRGRAARGQARARPAGRRRRCGRGRARASCPRCPRRPSGTGGASASERRA